MTRRAGLRRFALAWAGRLALAAVAITWGFAALAQSAPPKPTNFSVSLVETRAVLSAEVPSGTAVTRWDYRRKTGSNGNWGSWQNIVATNRKLIATVAGLERGKTYGFQVRAVNGAGEGPESDTKEVDVPAVAPPKPSSFKATAGDRQVTLSASIDTDGGSDITRWQYQRKTGSNGSYGNWKDIASSNAKTSISTVITDLTNGTAYGFKIRAENGAGRGGESESGMVTPSTTPAAPTGLTATAGNGSAALSWTAGGNGGSAITGWKYIKHSNNAWDSDWTAVPNSGASTTSYTVPSLTNGTAYKFKVRAVNANGDGAESAESGAVTPAAPASPGKPSVTAVIPIGGCILVRWQPPADNGGSAITGYEIGDPGSGIAHNEASASSREAKWPPAGNNRCSLVDHLTYGMQVRAKNANGEGNWSDEVGVKPTKTGVNVSNITWDAATLSVDNLSKAPWWYKGEQAGAQCKAVAKGTTTASLAGLDANTNYTYAVYYDSDCPSGSKLNSKSFKTLQALPPPKPDKPTVSAGNASVTLTSSVANNGGSAITKWKYTKAEKPAGQSDFGSFDSSWTEISSTSLSLSHTVTGLTNGTAYKFKVRAVNAQGDGAESDESGEVTPSASVTLTASDVTAATAKLSIANWSGAWSYKDGHKGHYISCTNVAAGTSEASLSGLTPGTDYLVYAYGAHNCPVNDNTWPRSRSVIFTTLLPKVEGVSITAGGGSLTVGWTAQSYSFGSTGYHVQWKSGTEDWSSDRQQDATTNSATISNLTGNTAYTVRVRSYHKGYMDRVKYGEWSDPATGTAQTQAVTLTASDVGHDSATLTIANHTGNWYYEANAAPHASCSSSAVTGTTKSLTGLSGNTSYTYRAYSDSGCSSELAAAGAFLTKPAKPAKPAVTSGAGSGKLGLSSSVTGGSGALTRWEYKWKEVGGGSESSWTHVSVTSTTLSHTVSGLDNDKSYTFMVRAVNATGTGPESAESDEATPQGNQGGGGNPPNSGVDLTPSFAAGVAIPDQVYTLNAVIEPYVLPEATGGDGALTYALTPALPAGLEFDAAARTLSGMPTAVSEAGVYTYTATDSDATDPDSATLTFTIEVVAPATLTASAVKETTATLTITGYTGNWWYRGSQQGAECTAVGADTATASLSGLTGGKSHVYKAYGDKGCTAELTTDDTDAEFSTVGLTAGSITSTEATLRIANWTAAWWHQGNQSGAKCTSADANTATASLSGLTAGTSYTYRVYSAIGCGSADEIADVDFETPAATVLEGARDAVRKVLNRTLAAVGARTLTSVLGSIGARFADGVPGMSLTLAGEAVPLEVGAAPAGIADGNCTTGIPDCGAADSRAVGPDELFRTSAFNMLLGAAPGEAGVAAGPLWSLWGRGDFGSFEGRPEPGSSYSGEMRTGWLGFDGRAGQWVVGLAVSHGDSETDYVFDSGGGIDGRGRLETELTAVYPYGRWTFADGLELRGVVGTGTGEARHRPEEGAHETSDLSMQMASTGLRRALPAPGGLNLALRADASVVRLDTGDGPEIVSGVSADSWRLRAGLEASRSFALEDGAALESFVEAAGRRDGGDGVTGTGLEMAGGVRYTAARLQLEARGRWLAAHSEEGARERGVSVTARVGPGARGRGLSLSLSPRWGADADTLEALWRDEMPGRAGDEAGAVDAGALDARIGYGFAPGSGSLLTPFAEMGLSEGDSRRVRLGTRFEAERGDLALELSGERRESVGAPPDHGVRLDVRLRF